MTGGAGYIGSHALKPLESAGYDVIVYDNLSEGHQDAVIAGKLVVGDLADEKALDAVFKEHNITAVMHFASNCYVGESVSEPQKYFVNNLANTLNLLRVMLANDVKRFVFSSSCSVYGAPITLPIREDHPRAPVNPYGMSKHFVEQILAVYAKSYKLRYATLRYFNAAGASSVENIGEDHDPETHLIPIVLKAALNEGVTVKVYGDDYNTSDGTCIRDYVHVDDIISAHILSLDAIFEKDRSFTFNVGSGAGYTVKEVIKAAKEITRKNIDYEIMQRRPGDVDSLVASAAKIHKELGWEPKRLKLADIISTAWNWHKNNPAGFDDKEEGR